MNQRFAVAEGFHSEAAENVRQQAANALAVLRGEMAGMVVNLPSGRRWRLSRYA